MDFEKQAKIVKGFIDLDHTFDKDRNSKNYYGFISPFTPRRYYLLGDGDRESYDDLDSDYKGSPSITFHEFGDGITITRESHRSTRYTMMQSGNDPIYEYTGHDSVYFLVQNDGAVVEGDEAISCIEKATGIRLKAPAYEKDLLDYYKRFAIIGSSEAADHESGGHGMDFDDRDDRDQPDKRSLSHQAKNIMSQRVPWIYKPGGEGEYRSELIFSLFGIKNASRSDENTLKRLVKETAEKETE